jgi:hypothetical protein
MIAITTKSSMRVKAVLSPRHPAILDLVIRLVLFAIVDWTEKARQRLNLS